MNQHFMHPNMDPQRSVSCILITKLQNSGNFRISISAGEMTDGKTQRFKVCRALRMMFSVDRWSSGISNATSATSFWNFGP